MIRHPERDTGPSLGMSGKQGNIIAVDEYYLIGIDASAEAASSEAPTISPDEPAADIPSPNAAAGSDHYGLKACAPEKGMVILYHAGQPSQCPGCGGTNWNIGRITAECAHCTFAIDLVQSQR